MLWWSGAQRSVAPGLRIGLCFWCDDQFVSPGAHNQGQFTLIYQWIVTGASTLEATIEPCLVKTRCVLTLALLPSGILFCWLPFLLWAMPS